MGLDKRLKQNMLVRARSRGLSEHQTRMKPKLCSAAARGPVLREQRTGRGPQIPEGQDLDPQMVGWGAGECSLGWVCLVRRQSTLPP